MTSQDDEESGRDKVPQKLVKDKLAPATILLWFFMKQAISLCRSVDSSTRKSARFEVISSMRLL